MKDVWSSGIRRMKFRRLLKDDEIDEWAVFTHVIPNLLLTDHEDVWFWKLEPKGFSTKSLYTHLTTIMTHHMDNLIKAIWRWPCPKSQKSEIPPLGSDPLLSQYNG